MNYIFEYKKILTLAVLALSFICKVSAQQFSVPFIEIPNQSSVILSSPEQTKFNLLSNVATSVSKKHIKINPIQNYLIGD